jgi:uncharacterized protein (DUF4415 family)
MKKEFNFKGAKTVGERFKNRDVKVAVTARLDQDVIHWLRKESEKVALPYQTFMNSILKQAMNKSNLTEDRVKELIREELSKVS